jgi:hypothetical protein
MAVQHIDPAPPFDEAADRLEAEMNDTPFVPTPPAGFFEDGDPYSRFKATEAANAPPRVLRTLDELLEPALDRAERRAVGKEKPIPLPWPSVAEHFGGGLWPGVHFLVAGTGVGKTVLALQVTLHAARQGFPALYIGLELEATQIALRLVGEQASVPWSLLYLGKAGPAHIARAREAMPALRGLPLHVEFGRPQGWPVSELGRLADAMRAKYPAADGPGSRPFLVVLDFLQIVGAEEEGRTPELRERIGRAAYFARDVASRLEAIVFVICSTARDKYALLADACKAAGLEWDEDDAGRPTNRGVANPDAVVGLGKESGEIESSGDSVSVLARVPGTRKGAAQDMLFVTAKGRATGGRWSPLHFTGWSYREADDGGSFTLEAMGAAETARETKREEKKAAKEQAKVDKIVADAVALVRYVLAHPRCSARSARVNALADNSRRWTPAKAKLGAALVDDGGLTVDVSKLSEEVRRCLP